MRAKDPNLTWRLDLATFSGSKGVKYSKIVSKIQITSMVTYSQQRGDTPGVLHVPQPQNALDRRWYRQRGVPSLLPDACKLKCPSSVCIGPMGNAFLESVPKGARQRVHRVR